MPPPKASIALPPNPAQNLKASIWPPVWANAHPKLKAKYNKLLNCSTRTRPYTSDNGAKNSGPIAYDKTKIDNTIAVSNSVLIPRSRPSNGRAGATIEDDTGDMNVKEETTNTAAHLRLKLQFRGLAGSSASFQVTKYGSTSSGFLDVFSSTIASKSRSISIPAITSCSGWSSSF